MDNKKYVGPFHTIDSVLYKITELKARGYDEEDMYAGTIQEDNLTEQKSDANHRILDKMDSSKEQGLSGEPLDNKDENQQLVDNAPTVPRVNTRNL